MNRPPDRRSRPSHPSLPAFLLVTGITVLIIGLAIVSTFG